MYSHTCPPLPFAMAIHFSWLFSPLAKRGCGKKRCLYFSVLQAIKLFLFSLLLPVCSRWPMNNRESAMVVVVETNHLILDSPLPILSQRRPRGQRMYKQCFLRGKVLETIFHSRTLIAMLLPSARNACLSSLLLAYKELIAGFLSSWALEPKHGFGH